MKQDGPAAWSRAPEKTTPMGGAVRANGTKTEVTSRTCSESGVPCRLGTSEYPGEMLICWSADQPPGLADVTDSRNGLSAQKHHVALSGYPWLVEHVNRWRVTKTMEGQGRLPGGDTGCTAEDREDDGQCVRKEQTRLVTLVTGNAGCALCDPCTVLGELRPTLGPRLGMPAL